MNVQEITVSAGKKTNTGNYESKDFFVALKANVTNTNVEKEVAELQTLAERLIEKQEKDWLEAHKPKVEKRGI